MVIHKIYPSDSFLVKNDIQIHLQLEDGYPVHSLLIKYDIHNCGRKCHTA